MLATQSLDLERSERKLWLVKVPHVVATLWKAQCEQSAQSTGIDETVAAQELGKITFVQSGDPAESTGYLDVAGAEAAGIPRRYRMAVLPDTPLPEVVPMSYQQAETGGPMTQFRVEGKVLNRYDLQPLNTFDDAKGSVTVDPAYRLLSKRRMEQSEAKTRVVQEYRQDRTAAMQQMVTQQRENMATRKQNVMTKAMAMEKKRTRMEKDQLETLLFQLFGKAKAWTFLQLQKETQQPATFLKEVLAGIAQLVKKGPGKDQYVLKREFAGADDDETAA